MVKLFVGNLQEGSISSDDLKPLFESYGNVTECEVIKNYAFVHVDVEDNGDAIIRELNGTDLKGRNIKIEISESKGKRKPSIKIFIGNVADGTTDDDVRQLFADQDVEVLEADVINGKNYAFVHVDASSGKGRIHQVIKEINDSELNGNNVRVQLSTGGDRGGGRGGPGFGGGRGMGGGGRGASRGWVGGFRSAPYPPRDGGGYGGGRSGGGGGGYGGGGSGGYGGGSGYGGSGGGGYGGGGGGYGGGGSGGGYGGGRSSAGGGYGGGEDSSMFTRRGGDSGGYGSGGGGGGYSTGGSGGYGGGGSGGGGGYGAAYSTGSGGGGYGAGGY